MLKAFGKAAHQGKNPLDIQGETLKNYYGTGVDVHKLNGKLPAPAKGWTLPGHNYPGPYNPLDKQLKYDPETGNIQEIFQH